MAKNFGSGESWIRGVIARQLGPLTYMVDVSGGCVWKRHVDHLKEFNLPQSSPSVAPEAEINIDISSHSTSTDIEEAGDVQPDPSVETNSSTDDAVHPESPSPETDPSNSGASPSTPETTSTSPRHYPSRSNRPPEHFDSQAW